MEADSAPPDPWADQGCDDITDEVLSESERNSSHQYPKLRKPEDTEQTESSETKSVRSRLRAGYTRRVHSECNVADIEKECPEDETSEVDLSWQYLRTLQKFTTQKHGLRIFKAPFNYIQSLPQTFDKFTTLVELELSYNEFTEIPKVIAELPLLRALVMVGNRIHCVPDELLQLKNLQVLRLGLNKFTSFPTNILESESLLTLHLNNNEITSFSEFTLNSKHTKLGILNLEKNHIETLPGSISLLTSLRSLCLNYNMLTELPDTLGDVTDLVGLFAKGNQLQRLPASLSKLKRLSTLDLSSNSLSEFPSEWFFTPEASPSKPPQEPQEKGTIVRQGDGQMPNADTTTNDSGACTDISASASETSGTTEGSTADDAKKKKKKKKTKILTETEEAELMISHRSRHHANETPEKLLQMYNELKQQQQDRQQKKKKEPEPKPVRPKRVERRVYNVGMQSSQSADRVHDDAHQVNACEQKYTDTTPIDSERASEGASLEEEKQREASATTVEPPPQEHEITSPTPTISQADKSTDVVGTAISDECDEQPQIISFEETETASPQHEESNTKSNTQLQECTPEQKTSIEKESSSIVRVFEKVTSPLLDLSANDVVASTEQRREEEQEEPPQDEQRELQERSESPVEISSEELEHCTMATENGDSTEKPASAKEREKKRRTAGAKLNRELSIHKKAKKEFLSNIFVSLKMLYLGENKFTELPKSFFSTFGQLKALDLSRNSLKELPAFSLAAKKSLKVLLLQCNNLSSLPLGLTRMDSLVELNVSSNFIRKLLLPPSVTLVSAGYNPLINPPIGYPDEEVEELDLTGCSLGVAPILQSPKRLRVLCLAGNQLQEFPAFATRCPMLRMADFSFNKIANTEGLAELLPTDCEFCCQHQRTRPKAALNDMPTSATATTGTVTGAMLSKSASLPLTPSTPTTMPSPLPKEKMAKRTVIGLSEMRGRRQTMEDQTLVKHLCSGDLLCIFDGHGGDTVSKLASEHAFDILKPALEACDLSAIRKQLRDGIRELNARIRTSIPPNRKVGSTLLLCFITATHVITANVGDSRAVLCHKADEQPSALRLSVDHKPLDAKEYSHIKLHNGFVTEMGRVNGVLAVSRSLGDFFITAPRLRSKSFSESSPKKQRAPAEASRTSQEYPAAGFARDNDYHSRSNSSSHNNNSNSNDNNNNESNNDSRGTSLSADSLKYEMQQSLISDTPFISVHQLTAEDEFIVMACDGLWDVISDAEAVRIVSRSLFSMLETVEQAALRLKYQAYENGSEDNITVFIVLLQSGKEKWNQLVAKRKELLKEKKRKKEEEKSSAEPLK